MKRNSEQLKLLSSRIFHDIQGYLEKEKVSEAEVIGMLNVLRTYYLNDVTGHLMIVNKEELERLEKENG